MAEDRRIATERLRRLARLFEEDEAKKSREIEEVLKKLEKLEENLEGSKKEISDLEAEIERSELQRGEESWNLEECFKNEDDKIFGKRQVVYCIVSVCVTVLLVWDLQLLLPLSIVFSPLLLYLLASTRAPRVSSTPVQSRPHTVANSMTPLPIGGRGPDLTRNKGGRI